MKQIILIVLLLLIYKSYAQGTDKPEKNSVTQSFQYGGNYYDSIKWTYVRKYCKYNALIKNNWKQYYKINLFDTIQTKQNNLIYPIYFDSYGSLYPNLSFLNMLRDRDFKKGWMCDKDLNKYSLHTFFRNNRFRRVVQYNVKAKGKVEDSIFYNMLLSKLDTWEGKGEENRTNFYKIWDSTRYGQVIQELKKRITEKGVTKIIFFVHGYNVPYSLAALQALELQNYIQSVNDKDTILMIPVFWPSNDSKKCNLTENDTEFKGFNISDNRKFLRGGVRTGTLWWYYTNQAYFAAIGLRKILNGIYGVHVNGKEPEIILFSHSFGATVITSSLINTFSKMHIHRSIRDAADGDFSSLDSNTLKKLKVNDPLGFMMIKRFKQTDLPRQKVTLYLSAPAISGENTFIDMDTIALRNLKVYSTVNKMDPVLTKANTGIFRNIIKASDFGNTSMGCDYNGDCNNVKQCFSNPSCVENSQLNFKEHDFFVYLNDSIYKASVKKMVEEATPYTSSKTSNKTFDEKFDRLMYLTSLKNYHAIELGVFKNKKFDHLTCAKDLTINTSADQAARYLVRDLIFEEKPNEFSQTSLPKTREKIVKKNDPFALVILRRELLEDQDPLKSDFLKGKLIQLVDKQISERCYKSFSMYSYKTQYEHPIKFVSIQSGNDLFTPTGLYATFFNKDLKKTLPLFQRNDDRDYTGSLLIEVGTDYLRMPRRRNLNSYQTVLYGFDVYTPYFRDTTIFTKNDTFNIYDRPHASFQYFGWSKNGLSRRSIYRWSVLIKFGKIGGFNGSNFQAALHQDISRSPRPRGWKAQIANNGRLGISIEGSHEWEIKIKEAFDPPRDNYFWKMCWQFITNWKVGTYMTNLSAGIQLTNKNFIQNNPHHIQIRTRQNVVQRFDNLTYAISFLATGVKHNTMLQGYGIFDTNESKDDPLTPKSLHVLTRNQVKPLTYNLNLLISYTARYATFFYKWSSFSPETNLNDTRAKRNPDDVETMKIGHRWHHFAVIGITFNVRKY